MAGHDLGNPQMTAGRTLPWLQDSDEDDVWGLWQVDYRDVIILGTDGMKMDTYNLTVHDLAQPAAYQELKSILLRAAGE